MVKKMLLHKISIDPKGGFTNVEWKDWYMMILKLVSNAVRINTYFLPGKEEAEFTLTLNNGDKRTLRITIEQVIKAMDGKNRLEATYGLYDLIRPEYLRQDIENGRPEDVVDDMAEDVVDEFIENAVAFGYKEIVRIVNNYYSCVMLEYEGRREPFIFDREDIEMLRRMPSEEFNIKTRQLLSDPDRISTYLKDIL